ncbi:hypothetical protein V6N11_074735 [Hibiscus sabdariffa]|uniref:RRM domain-containing protein n=1 Tax=Hibiscus sabdariffa TaxID=183260 RepID=A0ABR2R4D7_9ROSI
MSHFGRSGPPDITDTYSLLVLNITFRTTADDLFPLFDKYGKVVDIFIPKDRRTGDSRGFAFVRYKYADEAQKAVDRLDGRVVDGREITVQFAKYGPNAERIQKGRIIESFPRSRSRSPHRRQRDDHYRDRDYRRRSRSRSYDRYERDRYHGKDRDSRRRSRSRSASPVHSKGRGRGRYDDDRRSISRSRSVSPARRSPTPQKSPSLRKASPPRGESADRRSRDGRSPSPRSVSPRGRPADRRSRDGRSLSPRSVSPRGRPADRRSYGATMGGLQVLEVFHREDGLLIQGARLLETWRLMNHLTDGIVEYPEIWRSMFPVAVLLMLRTFKYRLFSSIAMFGERLNWANGHDVAYADCRDCLLTILTERYGDCCSTIDRYRSCEVVAVPILLYILLLLDNRRLITCSRLLLPCWIMFKMVLAVA